jgi:hypothetical protein
MNMQSVLRALSRQLDNLSKPNRQKTLRKSWPRLPRLELLDERITPTTFTVDSVLDTASAGTLRWAITKANTTAGFDIIRFNIPGAGVQTIHPLTQLPDLTDPTGAKIDGYTQPGASPNTLTVGNDAKLRIELDGSSAGAAVDGLRLTAGHNTVRGLAINHFSRFGVYISTSSNNVIAGNFIGTDATGTLDRGNGSDGVFTQSDAPNNRIGGTAPADRNVLSGNGEPDVGSGAGATLRSAGNVVQGNYIGVTASGTIALPNVGNVNYGGVNIYNQGNTIGGAVPGARNVIAGNTGVGILMYNGTAFIPNPAPTLIQGNYIGVGADGFTPLGNRTYGIYLALDSIKVQIGGATPGTGNVISDNGGFNIVIDGVTSWRGASNATIQGNYIGTDATGLLPVGANRIGIYDYGTTGLRVGGPAPVPGTGPGNVFANHNESALVLLGHNGQVQGNVIGLGRDGATVVGPQAVGIRLMGSNNLIGGAGNARNVISGNGQGVVFDLAGSTGNVMAGNFVGTDVTGTLSRGNGVGVTLERGANGNRIGGKNLISGNTQDGVVLRDAGTDNNVINGNRIGTNAAGTDVVRNGRHGVVIAAGASRNLVGGFSATARNVIGGNIDGVQITGPTTNGNRVAGNFVGLTAAGTTVLPGGGANNFGIEIGNGAAGTVIGGAETGAGNVVSGNNQGIVIASATSVAVVGNRIGTDAAGRRSVANNVGVLLGVGSTFNRIGGPTRADRNVISGNNIGVLISNGGGGPTDNTIEGNLIGLNAAGTGPIGNGDGISLSASETPIPGFDIARTGVRGNRIENSVRTGVDLVGSRVVDNVVVGNQIRNNGRAGVAIREGASRNRIGGPAEVDRNIISGNEVYGVEIASLIDATPFVAASDNVVEANYIGTTTSGLAADANGIGVSIAGGQGTQVRGNLISANTNAGVVIVEPTSTGNVLQRNRIGTDRLGRRLGNGREGVIINVDASDNVVGGRLSDSDPSFGNVIAFNGRAGVTVGSAGLGENSFGNTIRLNSIYDNGGLGIDLGDDGATFNHTLLSDAGPNRFQNFPELTLAGGRLNGTIVGRPGETLIIDVYASPTADSSGFGEGRFYLGTVLVALDVSGNGSFSLDLPLLPHGWIISATATRKDTHDTSEFSKIVLVP